MKAYLRVFMNYKQDDWSKLLPMAKFAYNNIKNTSTSNTSFELNYSYHSRAFYKENIDSRSQSKSANEIVIELQYLIVVSKNNLEYAKEF